jgi:hypothetical protein
LTTPTPFGPFPVSAGAFADGNTILGVGVRVVSGGSVAGFKPTLRFDLDSDSYCPASSVGGVDGLTKGTKRTGIILRKSRTQADFGCVGH